MDPQSSEKDKNVINLLQGANCSNNNEESEDPLIDFQPEPKPNGNMNGHGEYHLNDEHDDGIIDSLIDFEDQELDMEHFQFAETKSVNEVELEKQQMQTKVDDEEADIAAESVKQLATPLEESEMTGMQENIIEISPVYESSDRIQQLVEASEITSAQITDSPKQDEEIQPGASGEKLQLQAQEFSTEHSCISKDKNLPDRSIEAHYENASTQEPPRSSHHHAVNGHGDTNVLESVTSCDSQGDAPHEKEYKKNEEIGADVQFLIDNMTVVGCRMEMGDQLVVSSLSEAPKTPKSSTSTKCKPKSAAGTQKKKEIIIVKKSIGEPRRPADVRPKTAIASRKSETGTAGGTRSPAAKASATASIARPRTATAQPQRVSAPEPTKPKPKVAESITNKTKKDTKTKCSADQNLSVKSPESQSGRSVGVDIFETSPLTAGLSEELKQLAKTTPSHLIRPSLSVNRPKTASSSLSPKQITPRKPTASTPKASTSSPLKTAKLSRSSIESSPKSRVKMGDSDGAGEKLKEQFAAFSRFGDTSSDGKQITLSNCDKWMKQAHVIDGKKITTTDTSILFKKLFKTSKKIGFEDFKKYAEELATSKKLEPKEILDKLAGCGAPGTTSATKAAHTGVIERLTDTSKYTGSHKERFDESGKGRGIAGRRNIQDDSGYVAAFKEKKEQEKVKSSEGARASPTPAK